MLIEFRVENFMNFKDELIFNLGQIKNYEYNTESIQNEIIKTCVIVGEIGSGKSNLGLAILDIKLHLTGEETYLNNNRPYKNLLSSGNAKFYYKFKFNSDYIIYQYEKDTPRHLICEEVLINDRRVMYYDHLLHNGEIYQKGIESLDGDFYVTQKSIVNYIKSNPSLLTNEDNKIFVEFIDFVYHMELVSSLMNNTLQYTSIANDIIENGKLKDFELFLKKAGIEFSLSVKEIDKHKELYCDYNGNEVNFCNLASSGIKSLTLFYAVLSNFFKKGFLFIDDMDAFYSHKLTRVVIEEVLKSHVQCFITAHNTSVIDNDLLRPDCYFNLMDGKIKSFAFSTQKELRKAHNLEKMYRAGAFDSN